MTRKESVAGTRFRHSRLSGPIKHAYDYQSVLLQANLAMNTTTRKTSRDWDV